MCSKIVIDNNRKIYLGNCCSYKSYYTSYNCCKKYVEVDDCCPKYVDVKCCCPKYVDVKCCCKKYVKVDDCYSYNVHKYEKRIYYCKCCDKYKIKKIRVC